MSITVSLLVEFLNMIYANVFCQWTKLLEERKRAVKILSYVFRPIWLCNHQREYAAARLLIWVPAWS